jgi:hypothetical protein
MPSSYLAVGVTEREFGTLYNTLRYFAPDGSSSASTAS